jgi:C1A family cysteine protease
VTLVGYLQAERRFIIRNSWGAAWGDGGWAYASEAYCAAAIDEAWGVYF